MIDPTVPDRLAAAWPALVQYAVRKWTKNIDDAEDLAQDAYLRALEAYRRGRFDGRSCAAYLRTVAQRHYLDLWRRANTRGRCSSVLVEGGRRAPLELAAHMASDDDPEGETIHAAERALLHEALTRALAAMTPGQRTAVLQSVEMTREQSAEAMGYSVHGLKSLRLRGNQKGRRVLEAEGWTSQGWAA